MPTIGRHVAKLSGYAPALPTPFDDNGDVDGEAFERLCDLQITCGATALVVCGTTGEASTLTSEEQGELIRIAVAVSRSRAGHCRSGLERDGSCDCLGQRCGSGRRRRRLVRRALLQQADAGGSLRPFP